MSEHVFPTHPEKFINDGISMRDAAALLAMHAAISALLQHDEIKLQYGDIADMAYQQADAMLSQRQKESEVRE